MWYATIDKDRYEGETFRELMGNIVGDCLSVTYRRTDAPAVKELWKYSEKRNNDIIWGEQRRWLVESYLHDRIAKEEIDDRSDEYIYQQQEAARADEAWAERA